MINLKKVLFLIISIIIGVFVYQENAEIIIPSEAIRLRIIANSNSIKDLYEKQKLKNDIELDITNLLDEVESIDDARFIINNNLDQINNLVASKIDNFTIKYGLNYFPKKIYKGVIYPEGEYESLVITIGQGIGDNFWCVLYPPLCLIEENDNTNDVEYQFLVSKVLGLQ